MIELKKLNNAELLQNIKQAVEKERKATTQVLHLLMEVEKRKLFAARGYDSLFSFAVGFLGYSEPAAHRRISAMRALREIPALEEKINSGDLNLTNLAQVQVFLRNEAKVLKSSNESSARITLNEKLELFKSVENKSTRECEKILRTRNPEALPQEKRRELTETKTELKLVLDEELVQKLDRLKNLWSHKNPRMTDAELIRQMAEFCLSKVDPEQKPSKKVENFKTPAPESKISGTPRTRYIPAGIRHAVWQRDQGKCQFKDPLTSKVCTSHRYLEYDHIQPWALGGANNLDNLRLLCSTHNRLRAVATFGELKKPVNSESFSG